MAKSVKVRANLDLSGVRKDLQKIKKEVAGTTVNFKSGSVNQTRQNIDKATKSTNIFGQSILDAGKKFTTWLILGKAIAGTLRIINEAILSVKTLDDNLTLMSFTSEFTNTQFNEMVDLTEDLAVSLGSTNDQVIEATKIYTNLNSTLEDIVKNSEAAVVLSNLGGAAFSISDSADALQSLQNQFGLTNEHALEIADTLTFISANLAMDFSKGLKEISSGISISGQLAKEAGLEYELYSAILGTTVEATRRSGSSISSGYVIWSL